MRIIVGSEAPGLSKRNRGWAERLLWLLQPDDVLVVGSPLEEEPLEYTARARGLCADSLSRQVIVRPQVGNPRLGDAAELVDALLRLKDDSEEQPVLDVTWPNRFFEGVKELFRLRTLLDVGKTTWNIDWNENKAWFRDVCEPAGVPMAVGGAVRRSQVPRLISEQISTLYPGVMLKSPRGRGGRGNLAVLSDSLTEDIFVGSSRKLLRSDPNYAAKLRTWLANAPESLVWEQVIPGAAPVSFEIEAGPCRVTVSKGVWLVGSGRMGGADFDTLRDPTGLRRARSTALTVAQLLMQKGFRGRGCIDVLLPNDGPAFACEFNGRYSGQTHIVHSSLSSLAGVWLDRTWPLDASTCSFDGFLAAARKIMDLTQATGREVKILPTSGINELGGLRYIIAGDTQAICTEADNALRLEL